ncbi:DNA replication checkpoint protein tel2, partial [Lachnellula willkommii]
MEGLLNPVSTSYKSKDKKEDAILVEVPRAPKATTKPTFQASTPEEALEILKNEPDYKALISTLRFLGKSNHDFNITSPSPVASQLVHALVAETLPNYWNVVYEPEEKNPKGGKQRKNRHLPDLQLLLACLRSVTGLNAILLSLKRHIQLSKETKKTPGGPNLQDILTILLQVLSALLKGDQSVEKIWSAIWASSDPPQKQRTVWNEFLGLVGGGKILGTVAEAEDIVHDLSQKIGEKYWIADGTGVGEGIAIRRAVVTALAEDKSDMETVLEKSLQQLGDQLYIKHTPTMQQEVHTQVLLLAAGQVSRKSPLRLAMMMRSGAHLNVVTNRLGSSSPRARFLGMVVGEALSGLVDKGDKKMDFKVDEMSTSEAKWYKSLTTVSDTIGSADFLKSELVALPTLKSQPRPSKPVKKPAPFNGSSKIISIEEVDDDDEEEDSDDDDLVPYAKPDSDPEDSDEDATNIIRDKSTVPVYIRDLITYLRDTDNYDRQKLGLQTAAPLIRRKANFGTEVSSHAEELATLLVGIQDKYDMDEFQDLRLQGMIAILVALPLKMGQWFSKTFFDGDYSISQRPNILKTRTFSSRMAVEAQRKKPTTNALAKVVADGFFFPLTGRFFIHLKARSNIAFDPFLLALFLKTIALLLHASGPNNMSLPQMTSEAWDLLLGLRTQATSDVGVLEGLLFAVMILIE